MRTTLAHKWSALFHHVLQHETRVTPEIAADALLLIEFLFDEWKGELRVRDYCPDARLLEEASIVIGALRTKSARAESIAAWPLKVFQQWEVRRPFHHYAAALLDSDWETFVLVAGSQSRTPELACSVADVWVVTRSQPLRVAWPLVLDQLLPPSQVPVAAAQSIIDVHGCASNADPTVIVFGSREDAQNESSLLPMWRVRCGGKRVVAVVGTFDVQDVIHQILTETC